VHCCGFRYRGSASREEGATEEGEKNIRGVCVHGAHVRRRWEGADGVGWSLQGVGAGESLKKKPQRKEGIRRKKKKKGKIHPKRKEPAKGGFPLPHPNNVPEENVGFSRSKKTEGAKKTS